MENLTPSDSAYYHGQYPIVAGESYQLKVEAPGFPSLISDSETAIPKIELQSQWSYTEDSSFIEWDLSFDDPAALNFYRLRLYTQINDSIEEVRAFGRSGEWLTLPGDVPFFSLNGKFEDQPFNGATASVQIRKATTEYVLDANYVPQLWPLQKIWAILEHRSPTLVEYERSLESHDHTREDIFFPTTPVFSNVDGGYGIWYSSVSDTVVIAFD